MLADAPVVLYKKDNKENKHTKKEMDDLAKKWREKKERDAREGKTVNFNDFLKQKND